MPTLTIPNEFVKYLDGLNATHPICTAYGSAFTAGANLFMYTEPVEASRCVTIIPYGGAPPRPDGYKYESLVQIRMKIDNKNNGMAAMQAMINTLDGNENVCASAPGLVIANQSQPMIINLIEGGEFVIIVANFTVRHIKL